MMNLGMGQPRPISETWVIFLRRTWYEHYGDYFLMGFQIHHILNEPLSICEVYTAIATDAALFVSELFSGVPILPLSP